MYPPIGARRSASMGAYTYSGDPTGCWSLLPSADPLQAASGWLGARTGGVPRRAACPLLYHIICRYNSRGGGAVGQRHFVFGRVLLPFDVEPQAASLLRASSKSVDLSPGSHLSKPPYDVGDFGVAARRCSTAPAPRPLFNSTHFKFVLGRCDIAEAAGFIGTGPNRL